MKIVILVIILGVSFFISFAYFHSGMIDRARFVSSANDLMLAHQNLHDGRLIHQTRVSVWTNRITVGNAVFQGEFIAEAPTLANYGSLVVAKDMTLIWLDKKTGPIVVRGTNGRLITPTRLR